MSYKEITSLFLVGAYVFGPTTVAAMQLADEWQLAMSIRRSGHDNEERKRQKLATATLEGNHDLTEAERVEIFQRLCRRAESRKKCVDCSANRVNIIGLGCPHTGHIKPSSKL